MPFDNDTDEMNPALDSVPPEPTQVSNQATQRNPEPRPVRSLAASILAGALASLAANFDKLDPTA